MNCTTTIEPLCYLSFAMGVGVTAEQFRRLALSFPEAYESSHMRHPDFRVRGGKLFATLAYPDKKWGMVKLTPEQQEEFVGAEPEVFVGLLRGWRGSLSWG
jgi:hypothetical protein